MYHLKKHSDTVSRFANSNFVNKIILQLCAFILVITERFIHIYNSHSSCVRLTMDLNYVPQKSYVRIILYFFNSCLTNQLILSIKLNVHKIRNATFHL